MIPADKSDSRRWVPGFIQPAKRQEQEPTRPAYLPDMERVFQEANWDNLSIEFCQTQENGAEGYVAMKLKNAPDRLKDKIYYVSSSCKFGIKDIRNINISLTNLVLDQFLRLC